MRKFLNKKLNQIKVQKITARKKIVMKVENFFFNRYFIFVKMKLIFEILLSVNDFELSSKRPYSHISLNQSVDSNDQNLPNKKPKELDVTILYLNKF